MNALTLLLISAPVLAFTWTYGGTRASILAQVMPWASLAALVGLFFLPQRHEGETWLMAEQRVLRSVVRDPFFWTALAFVAYLVIPLFNVSLCPNCDWKQIAAGANPYPPFRFLPFCCNPHEHAGVIWWFGPGFLAALGVRHGLTRSGKRAFFEGLAWNGAALAVLGIIQLVSGAKFPYWGEVAKPTHFFSVFGYSNAAGAFFALSYAISLGIWCQAMARVQAVGMDDKPLKHPFVSAHYPLVAVALNMFAVLATLCRAAMTISILFTALFVGYILLRAFSGDGWQRGLCFRHAVAACTLLLALFGAVFVYAPPEVGRELSSINSFALADRVSGKGQYHTRVASAMMREFPFFGVGGWGYKHFCYSFMDDRDMRSVQTVGGVNVHNDYLQYLAEHGLVGMGLLVASLVLLALPWWRTWQGLVKQAVAASRSSMGASTLAIFVVEPPVLWTLFALFGVFIHAFGDCPLRVPAILVTMFTMLPAVCGFLPHPKRKK